MRRPALVICTKPTAYARRRAAGLARSFWRVYFAPDGLPGPLLPLQPGRYCGLPSAALLRRETWVIPAGVQIPAHDTLMKSKKILAIIVDNPAILA